MRQFAEKPCDRRHDLFKFHVGRPSRRAEQILRRLIGVCLCFYFAVLVLFVAVEPQFIFPGSKKDHPARVEHIAQGAQDLRIPVDRKTYLYAWWLPSTKRNVPTILFFYGFNGVLGSQVERSILELRSSDRDLLSLTNVLLVDYRGYGASSPLNVSEASTREDALAAFHYLQLERKIPAQDIVIAGWSLGSGVATQVAIDEPEAKALILISPITSVSDVANTNSWIFRGPLRPAQWIRHDNDFNNVEKIAGVRMPLMIMAGSEDRIAPPWMAQRLNALAKGKKNLYLVEGAAHMNVITKDPRFSVSMLSQFLKSIEHH